MLWVFLEKLNLISLKHFYQLIKMVMKEKQFYCVACRKKVTLPEDDIKFKNLKNYKRGKVPALKGRCVKCDTKVTKFVKVKASKGLSQKYK